jgi:hypothetical protein
LEQGSTYSFRLRDEVGKWWSVPAVTVSNFGAEMTSASLTGITLTFDSLPGREYDIQWVESFGDLWVTVETVTASGEQTLVPVAYPDPTDPSGFFRVQLK